MGIIQTPVRAVGQRVALGWRPTSRVSPRHVAIDEAAKRNNGPASDCYIFQDSGTLSEPDMRLDEHPTLWAVELATASRKDKMGISIPNEYFSSHKAAVTDDYVRRVHRPCSDTS